MAEAARAAVEHDEDLAGAVDAEHARHALVVDGARSHHLDLEVVVAGAERAELLHPALAGRCALTCFGIGAGQAAAALDVRQVLGPAVARATHQPAPSTMTS